MELEPGVVVTNNGDVSVFSDLNGGELTQLREGSNPRWSPDGKLIVFDFRGDIWIVSSIGTELTQLTNTKMISEGIPSFSQDGRRITYTSNEVAEKEQTRNSDYNVWSMSLDGTNKIQHTQLKSWDSWPLSTKNGVYFLSGRAAAKKSDAVQRIWLLKN